SSSVSSSAIAQGVSWVRGGEHSPLHALRRRTLGARHRNLRGASSRRATGTRGTFGAVRWPDPPPPGPGRTVMNGWVIGTFSTWSPEFPSLARRPPPPLLSRSPPNRRPGVAGLVCYPATRVRVSSVRHLTGDVSEQPRRASPQVNANEKTGVEQRSRVPQNDARNEST